MVHRGNAYNQLSQFEDALKDFSQAIEVESNRGNAFVSRSTTLHNLGRPQDAIADLITAKAIFKKQKNVDAVVLIEQTLRDYQQNRESVQTQK